MKNVIRSLIRINNHSMEFLLITQKNELYKFYNNNYLITKIDLSMGNYYIEDNILYHTYGVNEDRVEKSMGNPIEKIEDVVSYLHLII